MSRYKRDELRDIKKSLKYALIHECLELEEQYEGLELYAEDLFDEIEFDIEERFKEYWKQQ